jgi:hypothetical protein
MLRAGLSRNQDASDFVLGNPKAWLGTAYHDVLSKISGNSCNSEELDQKVQELWEAAILGHYKRAQEHPLDQRFGDPLSWPGYHLTLAMLRLRAREVAAAEPYSRKGAREGANQDAKRVFLERKLAAFGGKLVGRPDLIQGNEIADYKTGELFEDGDLGQERVVKSSYVRQLRLYAFLVNEMLGWWPERGVLIPMAGDMVEVDLNRSACEEEASTAVSLLDQYSELLSNTNDPLGLASPSPEACKWCPYKLMCSEFWREADPSWSGQLDGSSVEGTLTGPPRTIQGGAGLAISLEVLAGTEESSQIELSPLALTMHQSLLAACGSDRIRIVGLHVRLDGSLSPTIRTVASLLDELPVLTINYAS